MRHILLSTALLLGAGVAAGAFAPVPIAAKLTAA